MDMNTAIDQLNLRDVRAYIAEKKKWPEAYAKQTEQDYRNFLKLYAENPQGEFVSTRSVDDFWHAHILHVSKYIDDCVSIFGFVLDHIPVVEEGKDLSSYYNRHTATQAAFKQAFGYEMGKSHEETAICFGDISQAICYGRNTEYSAICFGRGPAIAV